MKNYKDLEIYRISHELAVEVHKMTLRDLPKIEMYETGSQIRRSSKSVPATIVEGFGRKRYQTEFIRYITYAIASANETVEHLELLYETGSLKDKQLFDTLNYKYDKLGKKLFKFREAVIKNMDIDLPKSKLLVANI